MQWFYDMKIRTKLISGYLVIGMIAGLMGIVGIIELKSISLSSNMMFEKQLVPITELAEIANSFQRIRVNILSIIQAKSPEEIARFQERIKLFSAKISTHVEAY
jgi:methyl-accepting chemotaxis protein